MNLCLYLERPIRTGESLELGVPRAVHDVGSADEAAFIAVKSVLCRTTDYLVRHEVEAPGGSDAEDRVGGPGVIVVSDGDGLLVDAVNE